MKHQPVTIIIIRKVFVYFSFRQIMELLSRNHFNDLANTLNTRVLQGPQTFFTAHDNQLPYCEIVTIVTEECRVLTKCPGQRWP